MVVGWVCGCGCARHPAAPDAVRPLDGPEVIHVEELFELGVIGRG